MSLLSLAYIVPWRLSTAEISVTSLLECFNNQLKSGQNPLTMKLTLAKVAELARQDLRELKVLEASNKEITDTDDLSVCVELKKVNLSKNQLKTLDGLTYCTGITFLNLSENEVETLSGLHKLGLLAVLNASKNSLTHIEGIARLSKLKALILNDNKLKRIPHLAKLSELNTLVVSRNEIEDISPVRTLKSLTKLSASHNGIVVIPDFSDLHDLGELRLNDNKIMLIPDTLHLNFNLKILDLGNNRIAKLSDLEVLAKMPNLKQLTLKGNPAASEPGYKKKIADMIPSLEVLDGERFRGKKLHRILYMKQKKAEAEGKPIIIPAGKGGKAQHGQQPSGTASETAGQNQTTGVNVAARAKNAKGKYHGGEVPGSTETVQESNEAGESRQSKVKYKKATQLNTSDQPKHTDGKPGDHTERLGGESKRHKTPKNQGNGKQDAKADSQTATHSISDNKKTNKSQRRESEPPQDMLGKRRSVAEPEPSAVPSKKVKAADGKQPEPKNTVDGSGVVKVVTKQHVPKVDDVTALFATTAVEQNLGVGGDSAWD